MRDQLREQLCKAAPDGSSMVCLHSRFALPISVFLCCVMLTTKPSQAATEYSIFSSWAQHAGSFESIGFDEYPHATLITEQFAFLGVHFTDGDDYTLCCDSLIYPQDGAGLGSGSGSIHLLFDAPINSIAVDYPGEAWFSLYSSGELIHQSKGLGIGGAGLFRGVVSEVAFDEVLITDPFDGIVFLDTLYFATIPAPAGLALLAWHCLTGIGSRRRVTRSPSLAFS